MKRKLQNRDQFVESNNAQQPNHLNGVLNPNEMWRLWNQLHHQMASLIPAIIPLPPPVIPLPPPEGMGATQTSTIFVNSEAEMKKDEAKTEFNEIEKENVGKAELGENMEENNLEKDEDKNAENGGNESGGTFIPLAKDSDQLIRLLDETENQVEIFRDEAAKLMQKKETILETILGIKMTGRLLKLQQSEQDELELTANRIHGRCQAVNISVNIPRNEHQSRALREVNAAIDGEMTRRMQGDLVNTKARIRGFLNACMPEENEHIDDKFQSLIIACTVDDQKKIRRHSPKSSSRWNRRSNIRHKQLHKMMEICQKEC